VVDVLEGAAEGGELLAGLLGDEHLGQAVPVDRLAGLRRGVRHLLHHAVPAHLARLPSLSLSLLLAPPPPIYVRLGDGAGGQPATGASARWRVWDTPFGFFRLGLPGGLRWAGHFEDEWAGMELDHVHFFPS
jgi:hypothetical protein